MLTRYGRCSSNARLPTSSSCIRSALRPTSGWRGRTSRRLPTRRATAAPAPVRPCPWPPAPSVSRTQSDRRRPEPSVHRPRSPTLPRLLEASGGVDRISGEQEFVGLRIARGDHLAGVHAEPDGQAVAQRGSAWTRSRRSRAADSARAGSSSCATGRPKTAITASPMYFSTRPPCCSTASRAMANRRARSGRTSSGSSASPKRRRADDVGK